MRNMRLKKRLTFLSLAVVSLIALLMVLGIVSNGKVVGAAARMQSTPTALPDDSLWCGRLGVVVDNHPIFDGAQICPEYLVQELPYNGLATITSIAYAPTCGELDAPRDWCAALFFVRPDAGTLMWVGAYDRDSRTYELNTFASGLTTPNGLAWHDGAWYVSGGTNVYRLADENGDNVADRLELVIDNLPDGGGNWTQSIGISPDERLYVSVGASCDAAQFGCEETDPRRGALLSTNLDGGDAEIVASGLHNAFDFAWHPFSDEIWITESGREDWGEHAPLDELNHLTNDGAHFGWPDCAEMPDNQVITDSDFCQQTVSPAVTFPAHSKPAGMTFYSGEAFPEFEGDLLVVLSGSQNRRLPSGYALVRVCFDDEGNLESCLDRAGNPVLDTNGYATNQEILVPFDPYHGLDLDDLHIQGQSFYPEHPVDITISPEGWITISVMEGRIMRLRPTI